MSYFEQFLNEAEIHVPGSSTSIRQSVDDLYDDQLASFSFNQKIRGLLAGRIQSGKTLHVLGIISRAADEGFKLAIILTSDNNKLVNQTYERACLYLPELNVCSERDSIKFSQHTFDKPTVLVLKKNTKILGSWSQRILNSRSLHQSPLFIADDEADAASLNTLINSPKQSSKINTYLQSLFDEAPSVVYLQVTATPQAILLQTTESGWKPAFIHIFEPGYGYSGSDIFYSDSSLYVKYVCENELEILLASEIIPESLIKAVLSFLVSAAQLDELGISVCNMLVHPSVRVKDHETTEDKLHRSVKAILDSLQRGDEILISIMHSIWYDLQSTFQSLLDFNEIVKKLQGVIESTNVLVLNSVSRMDRDYDIGRNILIGGNVLGRGLTINQLQTTYYCRSSKIPQADTVWQHHRIFGYDRLVELCRIYMPPSTFKMYRELGEANNVLYGLMKERNVEEIGLMLPPGIRPTRSSVVKRDDLVFFTGGVNYFAFDPSDETTIELDNELGTSDTERYIDYKTALRIVEMQKSIASYDWDKESYVAGIKSLMSEEPSGKCFLVIRANRRISKETGTLLSPNDRALGDEHSGELVLTMYRLTGEKILGWGGKPLWVPNIKFPIGMTFWKM